MLWHGPSSWGDGLPNEVPLLFDEEDSPPRVPAPDMPLAPACH